VIARICFLSIAAFALADAEPRIFYSKSFPGSKPPYMEVNLDAQGKAEYREAPNEDNPIVFQLTDEETKTVFGLAHKLDRFKRPLESGLKVANMGMKSFRWEDGSNPPAEVKFNYTQDENGRLLLDWFERVAESELHFFALDRSIKYDRLGVHKALIDLNITWDRKRLVAVDQFLPMLDRIAKNESFLHMARERAAQLATEFRGKKTAE